ncbi:hemocyte protein-glutamine gamma-glutamyltransferase-like isoform X3 [Argopecten irradians]|uniref:hemocyte protein-glutamine gamma-glutamyltransferase-like isoform X3 n=2 Tax=Argopecten irradians TaxID=31199 RepID=UPI00372368AC
MSAMPYRRRGRFFVGPNNHRRRGFLRRRGIPNYFEDSCMNRWNVRIYSDKDPKPVDPERDDEDSEDDEVEMEVKKMITVEAVRFNIQQNVKAHHTDEYELTDKKADNPKGLSLVVRRGQPFTIDIDFDREFDEEKEDLKLIFATGSNPNQINGSKVQIIVSKKDVAGKWGAAIKDKNGKTVTLEIFTPATCLVGKWKFQVQSFSKGDKADKAGVCKIYSHSQLIYMLFNPWCKDDDVYHHDNEMREEYVLNDNGKIFIGSAKRIRGRPWNFGQFDNPVLDCVLDLLDRKNFPVKERGNPVRIVRKLTSLVNSCDNEGILVGNWSGDYEDGASPTSWSGSPSILEQYHKTKEPVCYGQCWVFSGVLTTCLRTLGIPARSITTFDSAHDTDGSMTIDIVLDQDFKLIDHLSNDSVWNFHVWNDAWMARKDIEDKDYGGWQACDATPQEASDGTYCCGPCPILAIKRGEVKLPYDSPFVFAEVNGDKVYWFQQNDGTMTKTIQKNVIGHYISTYRPRCKPVEKMNKVCYDSDWQNITSEYKYCEDTDAERAAILRANQASSRRDVYDRPEEGCQDVLFKTVQKEENCYGDSIEWEYKIENKSAETRTVGGEITLRSVYYTGVCCPPISVVPVNEVIAPGKVISMKLKVPFEEYFGHVKEGCHFNTYLIANVKETNQASTEKEVVVLDKPGLTLKAPATVTVDKKFQVDVSFTNPLPISLTGIELSVSGAALKETKYKPLQLVEKKSTFMFQVDITPKKLGKRKYTLVFNSKELVDVSGVVEVEVKDH